MIVDFRETGSSYNIMGEVEVNEEYKYLVIHLDNYPDWIYNCEAVYKRQSRLLLLKE